VRESSGNVGFIDMAGPAPEIVQARRAGLILASIYVYHRLCALRQTPIEPPEALTAREAEALRWIARGKSDWQVGQILSISEKTVNYHIENVKRKFGVATRVQAVVAAIQHRACDVDGSDPTWPPPSGAPVEH
jgi:DNA-binding CsgD family transcriptional regulator